YLAFGKHVALLTDARFSGFSAGACIGHVSPEALAGGPIGKLRDGDWIEIVIDRNRLEGSVNLVGEGERRFSAAEGAAVLAARAAGRARPRGGVWGPGATLAADTRLWAALQDASGGVWGGCVFDVGEIVKTLEAGKRALSNLTEPRPSGSGQGL